MISFSELTIIQNPTTWADIFKLDKLQPQALRGSYVSLVVSVSPTVLLRSHIYDKFDNHQSISLIDAIQLGMQRGFT